MPGTTIHGPSGRPRATGAPASTASRAPPSPGITVLAIRVARSHWRKRLGEKLELLLAESLRVAHEAGALRTKDLKRVTVDTTVQPKAVTFPTDAKLLHAAIQGLNRLAAKHGVRLRQSYLRIAKHAAMMAGRYAHAKQFKRHHRELRLLRSRLGRIIRDIGRKIARQY